MIYFLRSTLTFLCLYGLVALIADAVYFEQGFSLPLITEIAIAILLLQYLIGPWLIRLLLDIDWCAELPARNQQFLEELCAREGLPVPKVGIIRDANPNAFTFGRIQSDASIVVTDGLLQALTPEEVNAVIAHEAGHIKHWDFLTLTAAAIAPLLLYHLYYFARRLKEDHFGTWIAYAAYWVSELMVLSLSRTREFWADDFAARATGDASLLSSGLVKICYGMAKVERENAWAKQHGDDRQKADAARSAFVAGKIGVMGISTGEAALVLSGPSPQAAAALMRWDLENPWARIYQLLSTHPLTAFRIRALNRVATQQGLHARYPLPEDARIRLHRFPFEFALWAGPWVAGVAMLFLRGLEARHLAVIPAGVPELLAFTVLATWLGKIAYRYRGRFQPAAIRDLATDTLASNMRPRAVRIEGEVVGLGEPGTFWSPDLIVKDETGILFMLNRQSIPGARIVLAREVDKWVGLRVTIDGWYRRGPMPYVELHSLRAAEHPEHRSYSRWIQAAFAVIATAAGYWLLFIR